MSTENSIISAIKKIADMDSGQLQILHGIVTKVYAKTKDDFGMIDFTSQDEHVIIKNVAISSLSDELGGVYQEPMVDSPVTILWHTNTHRAVVLSYSHVRSVEILADQSVNIGMNNPENNNYSRSTYREDSILHEIKTRDKFFSSDSSSTKSATTIDKTSITQDENTISLKTEGSSQEMGKDSIALKSKSISLGERASEAAVLGNELVSLMRDFILECSRITTPTLLGTMPILNMANFQPLVGKLNQFLSKTVKVK